MNLRDLYTAKLLQCDLRSNEYLIRYEHIFFFAYFKTYLITKKRHTYEN